MILFVIIALCIFIYTLFADNWLIYHIKRDSRGKRPCIEILKDIDIWFWYNLGFNILNAATVFVISLCVLVVCAFVCPEEKSHWEFDINAMQDNLVTESQWYGRRGSVDGEISYFYSRTMSMGEKIEHIPADMTYVQYSNTERPHVEVHQTQLNIPEWCNKVFFLKWMNGKHTDYYILVVPEGTITNTGQYTIDMQ